MDIWDEIKKLTGYQSGNGGVDSYGVDHSGFSTRDELEYQSARLARENQLAEGFAKQGIAEENYPQYGTNFWGGSPENNYGFGTSNIKQNIENVTNRLNNNTNNGQVFANSDYTVNTESLVGKPSSYFQNNSASNTLGGNASGALNQNGSGNSINYDNYAMRQDLENNIKREQERAQQQSLIPPSNNSQITPIPSGKPLTSQEASYMFTPTHPDYGQIGSLEFDGQNLVWLQNGQPVKYYPAQSGHNDYQSAKYTNVSNEGPIPEGDYLLAQGSGQDYNNLSWREKNGLYNGIRWFELPDGWGKSRIPIQPLPDTNTFGRHSMYVHGGAVPGSAGCIDLTYRNDDFYNDWLKYNGNLPLKVKYPKGW